VTVERHDYHYFLLGLLNEFEPLALASKRDMEARSVDERRKIRKEEKLRLRTVLELALYLYCSVQWLVRKRER
jgi:hypothetical protein